MPPDGIRPATRDDLPSLGRMGGELARLHHGFDARRFMLPEGVEAGYVWWFERELKQKEVILLVAESSATLQGYAYAREEARDWNLLLDRHGALHDLWVDPSARGKGVAKRLVGAVMDEFARRGVPRVVLSTAFANEPAQRLFKALGWRGTMVEMTRELSPSRV